MKPVFVDTSGFVAYLVESETHHGRAVSLISRLNRDRIPLLTSDFVLDETYTLLKVRFGAFTAIRFGDKVRESRWVRVQFVGPELQDRAWSIFRRTIDQDFSFTDCTSFALMESARLDTALGFDRGFVRYGLSLLGEPPGQS